MAVKGMLMQIDGKKGVIMTPQGEFINIILPNKPVQLGEEIEAAVWTQRKPIKYILAVAAVILMVLMIPGYQHFYTNQAMAYVALDINPSIELAIDKNMEITVAEGLNSDGKKIVSEVKVTGMQLYSALPLLVEQAITDGYLILGRDNVVLSTVTVTDNNQAIKIEETKLQQAINKPIHDKELAARVVVEHSGATERDQAKKEGISTGKYLIYKEAQKQGIKLTVDEIRDQGIYQIEQQKKVKVEHILHKQPLYNVLEQQLSPEQKQELQQVLENVLQQLPPGQMKKIEEQRIKPEQIEQLRKQLQRLSTEPEKVHQQLNETMQRNLSPEQVEAIRSHLQKMMQQPRDKQMPNGQIQINERPIIDQKELLPKEGKHKDLDIEKQNYKKMPPGLEKKLYEGETEPWFAPGLGKQLEYEMKRINDDEHGNN